jgi:hypothetical protein
MLENVGGKAICEVRFAGLSELVMAGFEGW